MIPSRLLEDFWKLLEAGKRNEHDRVTAQHQSMDALGGVAPTQESVQKQKKNEEELLRLCYLGRNDELAHQATICGTARVQEARDKKQRIGLHFAASNGKTETVRALIARYACDADAEDEDGRTPLHFAASQGHTDTASVLCTFGRAWVDSSDSQDDTPLHLAARTGHTLTCLELLEQGASPHARNSKGLTPIGEAVVGGHLDTVSSIGDWDSACLLDRPKSFSLLHLACGQSRHNIASYLVTKVPNLLNDTHNPQRLSPLHSSVMVRSLPCVEALIGARCQPNLQDGSGRTPLDLIDEEPCVSSQEVAERNLEEEEARIKDMLIRNKSIFGASLSQSQATTKALEGGNHAKAQKSAQSHDQRRPSFLLQLAEELKACGGSFDKQKEVLLQLAKRYSGDTAALERCLGQGFSNGSEDQKKIDVVAAVAKTIAEMDRIDKGLEVLRTLKAAHEDDAIQDALRNSALKAALAESNRSREELRAMVMAQDRGGISPLIQNKLHGLQVFFTSRGFTPTAFSKEIAVEPGKESQARRQDEERIEKLERTMRSVTESSIKALLKFSEIQEGQSEAVQSVQAEAPVAAKTDAEAGTPSQAKTGATVRAEIWQACKRQVLLSLLSLVCTLALMWVLRRSGRLDMDFSDFPAAEEAPTLGSAEGGDPGTYSAGGTTFDEL